AHEEFQSISVSASTPSTAGTPRVDRNFWPMLGTSSRCSMAQGTIDHAPSLPRIGGKHMGFLGPTWYQGDPELPVGTLPHYTNRHALARIMQAGLLRPYRTLPDDVVPLVWLSSNGVWEPASGRAVAWNPAQPIGFDQLATLNGGLGRVLV